MKSRYTEYMAPGLRPPTLTLITGNIRLEGTKKEKKKLVNEFSELSRMSSREISKFSCLFCTKSYELYLNDKRGAADKIMRDLTDPGGALRENHRAKDTEPLSYRTSTFFWGMEWTKETYPEETFLTGEDWINVNLPTALRYDHFVGVVWEPPPKIHVFELDSHRRRRLVSNALVRSLHGVSSARRRWR